MLLNRRFLQFIFICWFCLTSIFVQKVFGQTNAQELKIVQLSDIHYDSILINIGSRMYGESRELFQAAINDINSLKNLDAIVSSGDNINRPSKKDLFNFLKTSKQLKIPFYITIGNHDVGLLGNSTKRFYINTLKKYYPYIKPEGKNTYYITDNIKGYKFIFLDGVIDGQISAHGLFPKEQLAWLDNKLKANENYKIIIVQHHPVVPPFEGGTHDVVNSDEYHGYLVDHMKSIGTTYQMENSTLYLRQEDVKYQADLISAYGIDLDVKTSDQIKIGGFIIENKANNVVIDESLDFALENQKDWFYKTSGLMIK